MIHFLLQYSEQYALLLPVRVPWYSRDDIKVLPFSTSKRKFGKFLKPVAYRTFCLLWRKQLPHLLVMKPMTDLCWTCQKHSAAVVSAANNTSDAKSQVLLEYDRVVVFERSFYKSMCDERKRSIKEHFTSNDEFEPPPPNSQLPANSNDIVAHYSFDYAQQIHFPSDPLQLGPLYFLTPRKCGIFGVNIEAIPRQVNFLCDEAGDWKRQ